MIDIQSPRNTGSRSSFFNLCSMVFLISLCILLPKQVWPQTIGPFHKSEPNMQVHQYLAGEAAFFWPGTNGIEPVSQAEWTAFFNSGHHELWNYIGARTVYAASAPNAGTVTYGGRYAATLVTTTVWSPPLPSLDVPYSEYDQSQFYSLDPFYDPLDNDDGSQNSGGNFTVGSWPHSGDDIMEGAHEEDLFFLHQAFPILYDLYGDSMFNPANDYLQDEFYNGADFDSAEVFYHHLWRRVAHNEKDLPMMGVSWSNTQSSWEEVAVMPDIFSGHPSPVQIAEAYWQLALDYYLGRQGQTQDKNLSFYFLGRIAHLLVDMCTPAHAHCDPHSPVWPDSYETFMGSPAVYAQYTHNELPVFASNGIVIGTKSWGYTNGTWPYGDFTYVRHDIPGKKWDPKELSEENARAAWDSQSALFRLFWATAEIADNFDSNDAAGEVDKGTRRAGGFSDFELRGIADKLMPQAMISVEELYRLFFDTVVQGLPRINLLSPADGAMLSLPPLFSWNGSNLGTDPVFAVDGSFSPDFTSYWSTYDDLGLLIAGNSWTLTAGAWNRIPAGQTVYWRVRGADLTAKPLVITASDEVWSFTKQ